jgi:hypothetical protein
MKRNQSTPPASISRRLWLAAAIGSAAILIACGGGSGGTVVAGGSGSGSGGSGGTGAVAGGSITGFGSIILNGVRFDDGTAGITLDDDKNSTDADLRLGMTVDIEGDVAADGTTGNAISIAGRSFVQGPISTINTATNQITVLGVTVTLTPRTVYDGAGVTGLNTLAVNDDVEIYGLPNGAQALKATRIERITNQNQTGQNQTGQNQTGQNQTGQNQTGSGITEVRLTGTVQNVTSSRFKINDITVQYRSAGLVNLPNGVVAGMVVRVKGSLSSNPSGIVASNVRQVSFVPAIKERQYATLEGLVTKFTSATDFEMNGLKVNVPDSGTITGIAALDSRVEVEGTGSNGVLVASKVRFQDENKVRQNKNEMHGKIYSIDQANKIFTMRGGTLIVQWDGNTIFESSLPNGEASLVVGSSVQVKGEVMGNVLLASQIGRDTSPK